MHHLVAHKCAATYHCIVSSDLRGFRHNFLHVVRLYLGFCLWLTLHFIRLIVVALAHAIAAATVTLHMSCSYFCLSDCKLQQHVIVARFPSSFFFILLLSFYFADVTDAWHLILVALQLLLFIACCCTCHSLVLFIHISFIFFAVATIAFVANCHYCCCYYCC